MDVNTKGTTILPRWKYLNEKGTPEHIEKVLALLTPEFRAEIQSGIMQNKWYPLDYLIQLVRAVDQVLGKGDLALLRDMAHYSADYALNSVYKVFFKIGSPEFIIKKASRVFSQYYSMGQLAVSQFGPKQIRIDLEGFIVPPPEFCLSVQWWIEKTMLLTGCKEVMVEHIYCRAKHDDKCVFGLRWR